MRTSRICIFNSAVFNALHVPFSVCMSKPFSFNQQADLARQLERYLTIALGTNTQIWLWCICSPACKGLGTSVSRLGVIT